MAEDGNKQQGINQPIRSILAAPEIGAIYANAVTVAISGTEMQMTFSLNGRPASAVFLPFPVAKSLEKTIGVALSDYEKRSDIKILPIEEIAARFK